MKPTYEAGVHIRYGGTGICLIERIEEMPFPGDMPTRLCYVLKPIHNVGMEISVPVDNETLCAKMQPLRSKDEIDRMLETAIQDEPLQWNADRKQRNTEFRKILAGGDAPMLLKMIHCILIQQAVLKETGKHLSGMDDNMRRDAIRMLNEEFGFSLGLSPEEASTYIYHKLNQK